MSFEIEGSGTLHANVLSMWLDYGEFPPSGVTVPSSELRLKSGLPFSLYVVDGAAGPQEGRALAAVAGSPEDLRSHPDGPLVRLHSACIFSEIGDNPSFDTWLHQGVGDPSEGIFGFTSAPSDECDCRAQRQEAQRRIAHEGGVYVDLAEQEGRGWGARGKARNISTAT